MLESVEFHNFKVLRDAVLPLSQFTLIIGPNGSGKSTAIQGMQAASNVTSMGYDQLLSFGAAPPAEVQVVLHWRKELTGHGGCLTRATWRNTEHPIAVHRRFVGDTPNNVASPAFDDALSRMRIFSFDPTAIASPVALQPKIELATNGSGLAGVLDQIRDREPERFDEINQQLRQWLPEFDRIVFETPVTGQRLVLLRTAIGGHRIPASQLSGGTILALALLTLAYLPVPPSIVCLEEPDRGIHPRLLRDVKESLYRLSYPSDFGETRKPVQVITTTHSPYMLDLFRDRPEEIVVSQKQGLSATFLRLSDLPDLQDIVHDAHLGDLWYSGILGGVPSNT